YSFGNRRNIRLMSVSFSGECIRNMHFNNRSSNGFNCISNTYGSVCISACIQDNSVIRKSGFLNFIDDFSFYITLKIVNFNILKFALKSLQEIFKSLTSVYFRFSFAKQIQVGSVNDDDFHGLAYMLTKVLFFTKNKNS